MPDFTSRRKARKNSKGQNNGQEKNAHLIELRRLFKAYETDAGDFLALKDINLTVEPGEFVAIVGKSGSGKSTLVNMVTGIDHPSEGEVYVGGVPVHALNENQIAMWRGRQVGVVFQFFQLLPTLTVIENVMLPMDFCKTYPRRQRRSRAMELLELVNIAEQAYKLPTMISGGQQQRAAIARSLANDPPIIVADEPTGNLDSHTARQVFLLFEELVSEGKTFLMVTHDEDLARRVTRNIVLADGETIDEWLAEALPTLSQEQLVRANRQLKRATFVPGQTIIREGQAVQAFYVITKGRVEMSKEHGPDEARKAVALGPGEHFGEAALLNARQSVVARAIGTGPVEVLALDKGSFMNLLAESPPTREALERSIAKKNAPDVIGSGGAWRCARCGATWDRQPVMLPSGSA